MPYAAPPAMSRHNPAFVEGGRLLAGPGERWPL
jgi:hypothetical protein